MHEPSWQWLNLLRRRFWQLGAVARIRSDQPIPHRGYGYEFQKLRKQLLPQAWGKPCVRCGEPLLKGQEIHLDHADWDRTKLLGFSHRACNLRAAAKKARAIQLYRKSRIKTDAHRW